MEFSSKDKLSLAVVPLDQLKDKLNGIYALLRNDSRKLLHRGHFDSLWDLKELAMVEGRGQVEIPSEWLKELEGMSSEQTCAVRAS